MRVLPLAFVVVAGASIALLAPEEKRATRTVGHQGRALRLRMVEAQTPPRGPRLCGEGETPNDRDPCIPAGPTSRAAFTRGTSGGTSSGGITSP